MDSDKIHFAAMVIVLALSFAVSDGYAIEITDTGPGGSQIFPQSGSVTESEDLWDGIIGWEGRLNLGASKFYVPFYIDIGTGSSEVTWEGNLGLGYEFKWLDILLTYRHLYYNMDDDKLVQDVSFGGPAFGLKFKFWAFFKDPNMPAKIETGWNWQSVGTV